MLAFPDRRINQQKDIQNILQNNVLRIKMMYFKIYIIVLRELLFYIYFIQIMLLRIAHKHPDKAVE